MYVICATVIYLIASLSAEAAVDGGCGYGSLHVTPSLSDYAPAPDYSFRFSLQAGAFTSFLLMQYVL